MLRLAGELTARLSNWHKSSIGAHKLPHAEGSVQIQDPIVNDSGSEASFLLDQLSLFRVCFFFSGS